MNFHVGQRVVCIKHGPWRVASTNEPIPANIDQPRRGRIYTISKLWDGGGLSFHEVEYPNWAASRFRPLVERKTDTGMSILKSILADAENYKVKETV